MSNNLRQIAKDLRSFVKRCKDVHYSDSLLISFLITGLLTIAPKLHADVASEQQEITAQTYDAITDLRQSFMRARKENEKSLKGAQSELVQLLKQGDQVIKSPWASFQFGTGFTNNDWGTTYRGRGGKYLEYYRRDNDLTKYVFDKDKHLYGATNLNIPRNQEPNSLTINPANVHEPYKPYVPERLDNINMPKEVVFDPALMFPTTVIPYINPTNDPTAGRSATNGNLASKVAVGSNYYGNGEMDTSWRTWGYSLADGTNVAVTTGGTRVNYTTNPTTSPGYNTSTNADYSTTDPGAGGVTHTNMDLVRVNNGVRLDISGDGTPSPSMNPTLNRSEFFINGKNNNGIKVTGTGTLNSERLTMYVNGSSTNAYTETPDYNNGIINIGTGTVTDTDSFLTVNGTHSNGFYNQSTGTMKLIGTEITVNGSANNAVRLRNTNGLSTTHSSRWTTITLNGEENNGIYIDDSTSDASATVHATNIHVDGTNNTGILLGSFEEGPHITTKNATLDMTYSNVYANNGRGIGIFKGTANLKDGARVIGNSGDVLIAINAYNYDTASPNITNTISFDGNSRDYAQLQATGNDNIGINIENGHEVRDTNTVIKGVPGKGWNIDFTGERNVAIKNNYFSKKLEIENTPTNTPSATGNMGAINVDGKDSIVFLNLGYASTGSKVQLDAVHLHGDRSAIAYLTYSNSDHLIDIDRINTGMFTGSLKFQGAIGDGSNPTSTVNSVGVFADTGQRAELRGENIGYNAPPSGQTQAIDNLKVDLNVGLNQLANNSTLVWADRGTVIEVENTYTNGLDLAGRISDGVRLDNGTKWGYKTPDSVVSKGSVIGYANGHLDEGYSGLHAIGSVANEPSEIQFKKPVDMLAKLGTAYLANAGGKITASETRAGGYGSIIAYANGENAVTKAGSEITVNGNIVAADNNLLGLDNNTGGNPHADTISGDQQHTYENIAAVALGGGKVKITGTTMATDATEAAGSATYAATAASTSLIYGMAAYAKGNTSSFSPSQVDIPNGVTVITGTDGALYATENGQINFKGDIINQNNVGLEIETLATNKATAVGVTNKRAGRGLSANLPANDHTKVTPFYVKRSVEGDTSRDSSGITFDTTNIDMYDGILLTGNKYNAANNPINTQNLYNVSRDYISTADAAANADKKKMAKYRNVDNVTVGIMTDDYRVNLGVINQGTELEWDNNGNTNAGKYLTTIGTYAGGMKFKNATRATGAAASRSGTAVGNRYLSTLINSELKITADKVDLEDIEKTRGATQVNDPFNDISMESTLVTIDTGKEVIGDVADGYRKGQGLNMANSLYRWDDATAVKSKWRKTKNTESGYINKGKINVTGGTGKGNGGTIADVNITGMNVAYGTVTNDTNAEVKIDRGYAIQGTDASILTNKGKIEVTGKYDATGQSNKRVNFISDPTPAGKNYGILGVSDTNNVTYNLDDTGATVNTLAINNDNGTIKVEGDLAVGIYGENRNNALASGVTINYNDATTASAGIDVENKNVTSQDARGVGIALINGSNTNYTNNWANAGGVITLEGFAGNLGAFAATDNNILTGKNGIGIYAESAEINLKSDTFTVKTEDNGVGLWAMDDSHVAPGANHQKTFQYNYNGANDKNGFAMAFGGRNQQLTTASNDLDIKFTNKADMNVSLQAEKAGTTTGTTKGIAGILVNTNDGADTVTNRGNIEEDKSKTNVRAYGAVVNKGTFVNYGNIKLKDSLDHQASQITSEDMKKVNVGIFANSTNKLDTTITNRGDITIGDSTNNKNIGSWAIYGYNVNTDSKEDGSKSKITINRNNYGIYSGDGNVNIKNTKLLVGNDTVLGHVQTTAGVSTAPGAYPIDRQNGQYSNANDLLSSLDKPRELDSAIGVYIDKGSIARDINVSADMDIDRFSFGIVMAEKNGGPTTNVTIGSPTDAPTIVLASNKNAGGQVKSTAPSNPKVPEETKEQGNSVYYYSADTESRGKSYANVSMNGDYNTAYYTKGSMDNYGTIDLRSKYDVDNNNVARGYGNVGIFSANTSAPSTNYGTITTGMSDTVNMEYSAAMAAGRNHYKTDGNFDKTTEEGYIVNKGDIIVKEKEGIGMFATGAGSRAINYGNIRLEGESAIGMYLDRGAIGENYGNIEGNAQSLKGVVAINGGYIKNYGHINVTGSGSYGIVTDGSRFIVDANGNPTEVLQSTDSRYTSTSAVTAGQTNGKGGTDLYGGTESSIEEGTSGNPKTTGVGTTITAPDIVPITKVSVDGIDTPIFNIETDAANPGDWAKTVTVSSSIQTGGTRIIDLSAKNEWGNPVWEHAYKDPLSEVTSIGMYVDTSGVRYTNPIDGIQNLPKLGKVDLYFGPEATMYTNSKAIRIGDKVDANGTVTKSNILKPFNDALSRLPGGAKVNVLSGSLTWQVLAKLDSNNQLSEIYMSKVPYHSFAYDNDKSLVNFTNNLDNIYEIAKPQSAEKVIFNKLNSLGNGEGHILAQAFDQMRGHIYGGVQQRIKSTSDILTGEMNGLRSDRNVSKDSNKFKAFGQRNEFKTDTAGMPDWYSNAGGFAFVHEDETVRLGQSSGWSAGVVNNYFTFKDLSKSYENQAMAKVGVFKTIPLDANGTFVLSLGGDGFFGRNDMKRRFWVVDQEFRAKASYYSYGAGLNAGLEKAFVINDGFSIVPNVGIRAEYGRFSSIHENGDMALNVKSDDYVSVKPSAGIDFRYSQEVFKNSNLTASLGFAYENEIGKLYDVENEARIVGAWTDYFGIRGDKEDKRGNFKSDLKLGLDNGRFGFNVNTGYDSKGHNFRAGLGLKVLY